MVVQAQLLLELQSLLIVVLSVQAAVQGQLRL